MASEILDKPWVCIGLWVLGDDNWVSDYTLATVFALLLDSLDHEHRQVDKRRDGEQYDSKGKDLDCALLPKQTTFYRDHVVVVVQAGVCVDIFTVTNEYIDLTSLQF
ncbi:hypothetical protein GQ457_05G021300 [Hibiscus cannabinus]